jgi:allantoinase
MTLTWPNNARLALSLVVNVEEGAELNILDGDRGPEPVDELGIALRKPVRNFGNESNYQYGIKRGGPRVLALLESAGVKATFTAAAQALERAPELAVAIASAGHEVCAHGFRWRQQLGMDEVEETEFIKCAVESIERTTGSRPYGWLSRYLHTEHTRRLLREAGFLYHMDDFSDDVPFWADAGGKPMIILPYALDSNDMKMWNAPAYTPDQWLKYALDSFDWLYQEAATAPRMMSLGVHLRIIGRPGRIGALKSFIAHVTSKPDVWVTTRLAIARHFEQHGPRAAS